MDNIEDLEQALAYPWINGRFFSILLKSVVEGHYRAFSVFLGLREQVKRLSPTPSGIFGKNNLHARVLLATF